ncbi:aminoglycoside 6-adenylyltransferase [Romboutsia weinsteinii]|uniref:Aminoglycoside 6-adenylyltransferase n=1 Tax=Romboutsia weinsteinii TaxID=2020949 RepID=A0A371J3M5_9FIRM|nr:aminoglycoside 6-adenylyltransferase [Romboutsia weinsteinii]
MRNEKEMFDLILNYANSDDRVLAVGLNGSRTNKNVPKDEFQDYDVVFVVDNVFSFIDDPTWIDYFGDRIIMQKPESMELFPPSLGGMFSYLMLFEDKNRIDLILCPKEQKDNWHRGDKLSKILLDKGNYLSKIADSTDEDYHISKPNKQKFLDCCNEFWWVSTYVVKGLCRDEIFYATDHLYNNLSSELLRMVSWKVGIDYGFDFSIGKNYKYIKNYIDENTYNKLLSLLDMSSKEKIWTSLEATQCMFDKFAKEVSSYLDYSYEDQGFEKVLLYTKEYKDKYI